MLLKELKEIKTLLMAIVLLLAVLLGLTVSAALACDDGAWLGPGWDRRSLDKTIITDRKGETHIYHEAPGTGQSYISEPRVYPDRAEEALKLYMRSKGFVIR